MVDTNYENSCYLSAFATITRLGLYEAYALLWGGPIPSEDSYDELPAAHRGWFQRRLLALGFERRECPKAYELLKKDALVIIAWPHYDTLHCVVWDGQLRVRVDCCGRDTTRYHRGVAIEAYTLSEEARAKLVTGVEKPAKKDWDAAVKVYLDAKEAKRQAVIAAREAEHAKWIAEREARNAAARARTEQAFPGALFPEDHAVSLGA